MAVSTTATASAGPFAAKLAPLAERLRGSYSVVRPVSQVVLQLRGRPDADAFEIARNVVVGWIRNRAGRPLPPEALKGESFELEEVGSQRTAAVAIEHPRYWAARLDDSDRYVPRRDWVTEVGIAQHANKDAVFGARLHCVTIGEDQPFDPSIPGFVRTIVERAPNVRVEGRIISLDPWIVQTEDEVEALVACITNRGRRLDLIVCALPEGSEDPATATIRADQIHTRTLGSAHVAVITGPASFFLSERVGKEFSVFRGAVRTYRPGFDTTLDEPFRHPLALPERMIEWPEGGREGYERFLIGQTLVRAAEGRDANKQLPPFTEVRQVAAQLKLASARNAGSSDTDLLKLAEDENNSLRDAFEKDRTTYQGLVDQYEQERDLALEEAQQAQAANAHLRHRVRALEERLTSHAPVVSKIPIPKTLDDFESWCREHLSGSVETHNRAIQSVKKSRYEDIELIYKALLLLRDGYVPMKRGGGMDKKAFFDRLAKSALLRPTLPPDQYLDGEILRVGIH
jgi:hypothetical protein